MARGIAIYGSIQLREKHTQAYVRDVLKTKMEDQAKEDHCHHVQWMDQARCQRLACLYAMEARERFNLGIKDEQTGILYECKGESRSSHILHHLRKEDYAFLLDLGVSFVALVTKACEEFLEAHADKRTVEIAEQKLADAQKTCESSQGLVGNQARRPFPASLAPSLSTDPPQAELAPRAAQAHEKKLEQALAHAKQRAQDSEKMARARLNQARDAARSVGYPVSDDFLAQEAPPPTRSIDKHPSPPLPPSLGSIREESKKDRMSMFLLL